MKNYGRLLLLISILLTSSLGQAARSNSGMWLGIFPHFKIADKQRISLQAEVRKIGEEPFALIRPSYHYNLSDYVVLGAGYDLFTVRNTEQRVWPEVVLKTASPVLSQNLSLRIRQEFRFINKTSASAERLRVMLQTHFILSRKHGLSAFIFNEAFYSQSTFSGGSGDFDRNWLGARMRVRGKEAYYEFGGFWEKVNDATYSSGFVGVLWLGKKF